MADPHYVYFAWGQRRRWWRRDVGSVRAQVTLRRLPNSNVVRSVDALHSYPDRLDLLYVGETSRFARRRAQHEADTEKRWWTPLVVEWVVVELPSFPIAAAAEADWIPRALYNVKGSTNAYARKERARSATRRRRRRVRSHAFRAVGWVTGAVVAVLALRVAVSAGVL